MDMIFEVKNGSFGYKSKAILNDINFTVRDGEVMSILGSNGVGKTTLLKCMMGLLKWNSGISYIDGKNINEYKNKCNSSFCNVFCINYLCIWCRKLFIWTSFKRSRTNNTNANEFKNCFGLFNYNFWNFFNFKTRYFCSISK